MVSRIVNHGKHSLTVRVTAEDYERIRLVSAILGFTPNEYIVASAVRRSKDDEEGLREKGRI